VKCLGISNSQREHEDIPRDGTESRYEYDPETAFSNDMSHERVIEILFLILDSSTS